MRASIIVYIFSHHKIRMMNNFSEVFFTIKKHCEKQKTMAEISCFETIAKEARVPLTNLEKYLDHLQDIGLIKHSMNERYIYLTSLGKAQNEPVKN